MSTPIMRPSLRELLMIDNKKFSGSLKDPHAGLLLQRGLFEWDKAKANDVDGNQPPLAQSIVLEKVCKIKPSKLYEKAFERWENATNDANRFANTYAKIIGRLYTGLGVGTALETHLTTHHTYGMPILSGSGVKGAVAAYAAQIGLSESVVKILFGDENTAGAVVWHDAWWIPQYSFPFVEEIITTHHQKYYNREKKTDDMMEEPVPNSQIACTGSFYFVVECEHEAWRDFANQLLLDTLQDQGMGSKTASGYGYFEEDTERKSQAEEKRKQQEEQEQLARMSEYEKFIDRWQKLIFGESQPKYKANDQKHTDLFNELEQCLQAARDTENMTAEEKKNIAETFSVKKIKKRHEGWLSKKREEKIESLLRELRDE